MNKAKKILIAFSLVLLVFSLAATAGHLLEDYQARKHMGELARQPEDSPIGSGTGGGATAPPLSDEKVKEDEPVMLSKLQELYRRNPDIVGWLKIEDTVIDYPVMQNPQDGEYYLSHDFDKKESKHGLPFLDVHCQIDDGDILLIHGHYIKNGMMFADLMKYKEERFYQEHPTFQFSTLYETADYEIVAVILSKVYRKAEKIFKYYQVEKVGTPAEFDSYIQNVKQLALYDTGVTAQYGDKLVVLSTCEYSTENGRLAVIARKRQ
ncbi:hypothetical protein Desde_1584 [Desulfitobacterium dehalogenans ATCC 51507]|uniref:Class B sortase n=1 Tax=Desulfitobacterium dehalogenans (strain ATCC 51507 / DSM 9161 / JW/IU-DC1) TaxID=756499 RepID=I4A7Q4_DESDJ|nr:class B sortase [Desulfitobacterium dehalogenans]AFL99988.1 hypothetical protein Desde_1584 [Desulfitobacterium dehalogenans ATCC 51507]